MRMHTDSGTIKEHFILTGAGWGILIRGRFSYRQEFLKGGVAARVAVYRWFTGVVRELVFCSVRAD